MTKAEDLLNSVLSDGGATVFANVPDEAHIIIGDDRYMAVPDELKRLAVQYDHNIETVTFDCPRYWDDHDMSKMGIYINYLRVDKETGICEAENVTVDANNSSIMHFDWTISRNVTEVAGKLVFLVCVKSIDADGNEKNHWNSELCKDCYVSDGLEPDGEAIKELYADIIEQWRQIIVDTVKMRDSGDFDGATFTPSVDNDSVLSWTNNKGKPNPPAVNIRGKQGVSPTIQVTNIQGGHRITVTDIDGTKSFDVPNGSVEVTDAVVDLMNKVTYVGSDEPISSPVLWFDTNVTTPINPDVEAHVQRLVNERLGVIENGYY